MALILLSTSTLSFGQYYWYAVSEKNPGNIVDTAITNNLTDTIDPTDAAIDSLTGGATVEANGNARYDLEIDGINATTGRRIYITLNQAIDSIGISFETALTHPIGFGLYDYDNNLLASDTINGPGGSNQWTTAWIPFTAPTSTQYYIRTFKINDQLAYVDIQYLIFQLGQGGTQIDPCVDHCTNGIQDANCGETGIDCGGDCGACAGTPDCAGVIDGSAFLDDCGVCSGGTSGHEANSDKDACDVCFGDGTSCITPAISFDVVENQPIGTFIGIVPDSLYNASRVKTFDNDWQFAFISNDSIFTGLSLDYEHGYWGRIFEVPFIDDNGDTVIVEINCIDEDDSDNFRWATPTEISENGWNTDVNHAIIWGANSNTGPLGRNLNIRYDGNDGALFNNSQFKDTVSRTTIIHIHAAWYNSTDYGFNNVDMPEGTYLVFTNFQGQVKTWGHSMILNSSGAIPSCSFDGVKFTGEYVPGLTGDPNYLGWKTNRSTDLKGTFGFESEGVWPRRYGNYTGTYGGYADNSRDQHSALQVEPDDHDRLTIEYWNVHGAYFAGFNIKIDKRFTWSDRDTVRYCLVTDTEGEGIYWGYTRNANEGNEHFTNAYLGFCAFLRCGGEGVQLNWWAGTIENNVMWSSMDLPSEFQPGQTNMAQWRFIGRTVVQNNILLIGNHLMISDLPYTTNAANAGIPLERDSIIVRNNIFQSCWQFRLLYYQNNGPARQHLIIKDNWIGEARRHYAQMYEMYRSDHFAEQGPDHLFWSEIDPGDPVDWYNNETKTIRLIDNHYHSSWTNLTRFNNATGSGNVIIDTIPWARFADGGIFGNGSKTDAAKMVHYVPIRFYDSRDIPSDAEPERRGGWSWPYYTGDTTTYYKAIIPGEDPQLSETGGRTQLYRCLQDHGYESNGSDFHIPSNSPTYWEEINWTHTEGYQTPYPPDCVYTDSASWCGQLGIGIPYPDHL